jgi:hypothetical protein
MKKIKINTMEILYDKTKGLTYCCVGIPVPLFDKLSSTLFFY